MSGRVRTCQSDKELRNIQDVRREPGCEVVHLVRLTALIRDDVDEDVHCRVAVVRRWPVPK